MLNRIDLMGRLVKDPELRYTSSNTPVVSFRIAVDRDFGSKESGEKTADFIDVTAWRQTAEFISKHFAKGRMIVVSGRLQTRQYEDKEKNKRTAVEVVAESVYFGDSKPSNGSSAPSPQNSGSSLDDLAARYPGNVGFSEIGDDDGGELPF